jgi:hypothetical protein
VPSLRNGTDRRQASHIDRMILACFVLGLSTHRVAGRSECAGAKT